MQKENSFNEIDSLRLIQQMIETAKQEQKDDGKGWIIWGWMLFITSCSTILNIEYKWVNTFFFWNIFGIFTLLMGLFKIAKVVFVKKIDKLKTYTSEIFDKLNAGFFVSIMLVILSMSAGLLPRFGFTMLMNLYAFWILIYATVLNFKSSMIGAFMMWLLAFTALFVSTFKSVMILHAVGVLFGYIIPGHLANKKFNEQSKNSTKNS